MRLRLYLQEKYLETYNPKDFHSGEKLSDLFDTERLGLYVNPTKADMMMFRMNGMRFVADPFSKNLYVWDEEIEIHNQMMSYLMKKGLIPNKNKSMSGPFYTGFCQVEGSKLIATGTFEKDVSGDEWKWLDKYFSNRPKKGELS